MKNLIFCAVLVISTVSFADDSVDCKVNGQEVAANYNAATGAVTGTETVSGQTGDVQKGVSYTVMTADQVAKDDVVSGLARSAGVDVSKVKTAAVFLLAQEGDASLAIVKFNLADGSTRTELMDGWTPITCN